MGHVVTEVPKLPGRTLQSPPHRTQVSSHWVCHWLPQGMGWVPDSVGSVSTPLKQDSEKVESHTPDTRHGDSRSLMSVTVGCVHTSLVVTTVITHRKCSLNCSK